MGAVGIICIVFTPYLSPFFIEFSIPPDDDTWIPRYIAYSSIDIDNEV
jgi:hypothetical protein